MIMKADGEPGDGAGQGAAVHPVQGRHGAGTGRGAYREGEHRVSVWVTGDCHGDFNRFATRNFPQLKGMGRDDCVIIAADCGGVWAGEREDGHRLDWLEDKPFTTLFVDGNHENFDRLNAYPEREWHGGRVHEIRPHVLHLTRGRVFHIGGRSWFTMGGAASHDIEDGILDPAAPDFERWYWALRRMNARFRVPAALTRGKAQRSGFAAKVRSKEANAVFRGSGKRS